MIETERTILRPIESKDSEQLFAYRSDAETNKFQGWIPKGLEEAREFISRNPSQINQPESWFQLVIVAKETEEIIGDIGIHFIGADNHQSEIGCTISKQHQGKGFATECLRATVGYLFQELHKHRIVASIDPANTPSIKMVERLGFRKEAHFRESLLIRGEWVDDVIYALLQKEWDA